MPSFRKINKEGKYFNPDSLRLLRRITGVTQEGLAKRCGVSKRTIQRWEYLEHEPSKRHVERLAQVYHIEQEDFYLSTFDFVIRYLAPQFSETMWIIRKFYEEIQHLLSEDTTKALMDAVRLYSYLSKALRQSGMMSDVYGLPDYIDLDAFEDEQKKDSQVAREKAIVNILHSKPAQIAEALLKAAA